MLFLLETSIYICVSHENVIHWIWIKWIVILVVISVTLPLNMQAAYLQAITFSGILVKNVRDVEWFFYRFIFIGLL